METYSFHDGALPAGFSLDFQPALFNRNGFLRLQSTTEALSFYVLHEKRKTAMAWVHFFREDKVARSPLRAPFGSIEFCKLLSPRVLYDFIEYVEGKLRIKGVSEIHLKNPPRTYSPDLALLETMLFNKNYLVADAEVGAMIVVSDKGFAELIHPSEVQRLRQLHSAGLQLTRMEHTRLEDLYRFIEGCHGEKGYRLSIPLEQLRKTVEVFPEEYLFFGVMQGENIIAGSVSIRVKTNILYNFLVNHDKAFNHLSPPLLLMEGTYDYCREHGIGLFDLGTSALKGQPNFSLLDFKLRIGGEPTSKFSFYKKL